MEEFVHAGVQLGGSGEQSVVAAAGLRGETIGDLALHHDDNLAEGILELEEAQKDVGGDVVGEIADDFGAARQVAAGRAANASTTRGFPNRRSETIAIAR